MWPSSIIKNIISHTQLDQNALYNSVSPLISSSIIEVKGKDAEKFLQGQLSCDVNLVNTTHFSLGTHNTAKGRMISSFRLFSPEDNCYWLLVDKTLADTALKALQKYIIFSKASIQHRNDLLAYTSQGQATKIINLAPVHTKKIEEQITNTAGLVAQISNDEQLKTLLIIELENIASKRLLGHENLTFSDENTILNLQHEQGLAFVNNETSDSFIPQMLNYQHSSAISFKKGCYTGQEIVARTHYKGKIKRKLYQLTAEYQVNHSPKVGDELFLPQIDELHQKSIATIASIATINNIRDNLHILAVATPEIENHKILSNKFQQNFTVKYCQAVIDEKSLGK